MKTKLLTTVISTALILGGCGASASEPSDLSVPKTDESTVTELQIDDSVQVENGDDNVRNIDQPVIEEGIIDINEPSQSPVIEDISLFTPEDIGLLDNLSNQDWYFKEDPSWIIRFDDDVLIIGQENGQVTDVLKYKITEINHEEKRFIIHIVEKIDEHSTLQETKMILNYYCALIINGDELTYRNKINNPDQMTETVWLRK